ncbi:MAG: hypothetical protein ACLQDY_14645 [Streptosporangiaceae bacterium]
MGLTTVPRGVARLEYSAVRLPFTLLEGHVVARYWDDEAPFRLGFERFLGSLDGFAGWLLADDRIRRRGQALTQRTELRAMADELETQAQARPAHAEDELLAAQADARPVPERARQKRVDDKIAVAYQKEQEDKRRVRREADARAEGQQAQAEHAADEHADEAKQTDGRKPAKAEATMIKTRDARGRVSVTFTLDPAVGARTAAVCGEWNDWSPEADIMRREAGGGFSLTVELDAGRTYRFRYLLDGERWDNDWAADAYLPNSFGADDSVVDLTALAEAVPPAVRKAPAKKAAAKTTRKAAAPAAKPARKTTK